MHGKGARPARWCDRCWLGCPLMLPTAVQASAVSWGGQTLCGCEQAESLDQYSCMQHGSGLWQKCVLLITQ